MRPISLSVGTSLLVMVPISGPLQSAQGQNQAPTGIDQASSCSAQARSSTIKPAHALLRHDYIGSSLLRASSVSLSLAQPQLRLLIIAHVTPLRN
jgi:hypothetical protein